MANDDFDPVLFGKVLQRLDAQDKVLAELQGDMEELVNHFHERRAMNKMLMGAVSVIGFILGNLLQVWIFRGPGAH